MSQFLVEIMMRMVSEYYIVKLDSLVVGSDGKWRVWSAVDDSLWHLQEMINIFFIDCLVFSSPLFICNQTTPHCADDDIIVMTKLFD